MQNGYFRSISSTLTLFYSHKVFPRDRFVFILGISGPKVVVTEEPADHLKKEIILNVVRQGGNVGAVQIKWKSYPKQLWLGSNDILPVGGTVGFLTGESRQTLTINVLPDQLPEFNEVGVAIRKEL